MLHMCAEQIAGFEVWMKQSHRSPFGEKKDDYYQLCGALDHTLKRLKCNSTFPIHILLFNKNKTFRI